MSDELYRSRPVTDEALATARELATLSEDTWWRDVRDGTIEVATMTNGPVERYVVFADGSKTLVERESRSPADKWSLPVGCGGCLTILGTGTVLSLVADDPVWIGAAIVLGLVVTSIGEQLARRSWGDVERYLERSEGGSEGWRRL